jgi:hypothetical protein
MRLARPWVTPSGKCAGFAAPRCGCARSGAPAMLNTGRLARTGNALAQIQPRIGAHGHGNHLFSPTPGRHALAPELRDCGRRRDLG